MRGLGILESHSGGNLAAFLETHNDALIAYAKQEGDDTVVVVCNLDPQHAQEGVAVIPMAPMAVSASDIRARAARGEDLSARVPPPVADYIARHGLYR